jgi:hypothetical protein
MTNERVRTMEKNYGIRFIQYEGKDGHLVTKEKWFQTELARTKFIDLLGDYGKLHEILAYCDNDTEEE